MVPSAPASLYAADREGHAEAFLLHQQVIIIMRIMK